MQRAEKPAQKLSWFCLPALLAVLMGCKHLGDPTAVVDDGASQPSSSVPAVTSADADFTPVAFERLPAWRTDRITDILPVFLKSCDRLKKKKAATLLTNDPALGTIGDLVRACEQARRVPAGDEVQARFFFEKTFQPYLVSGSGGNEGLFTGYYEPLLRGSWTRDNFHRFPVYRKPEDLIALDLAKFPRAPSSPKLLGRVDRNAFVPYYTRAEIDRGALRGKQLEMLWVSSPVDLFFLHVQGSGRVQLPDKSIVRLSFDGRNGHQYTAIGRELIDRGVLTREKVSLQSIRAWLEANPQAAPDVMHKNKSYIFFRVNKDQDIKGALGIPLTPGRSLAVDPKAVPLGAILWLNTTDPLDPAGTRPLRRLVVAQDTGSAIKGAVRGDLFWGFGKDAEARAGLMNERGNYFIFLPRRNIS